MIICALVKHYLMHTRTVKCYRYHYMPYCGFKSFPWLFVYMYDSVLWSLAVSICVCCPGPIDPVLKGYCSPAGNDVLQYCIMQSFYQFMFVLRSGLVPGSFILWDKFIRALYCLGVMSLHYAYTLIRNKSMLMST